jgi:hypothetical protein
MSYPGELEELEVETLLDELLDELMDEELLLLLVEIELLDVETLDVEILLDELADELLSVSSILCLTRYRTTASLTLSGILPSTRCSAC